MYDAKGKTAGILVRISDDREGRALGVKRQEEDSRHLGDRLGVKVVRVYVENDISASTIAGDDRREFEDFMADWQAGVFDVPLAYTTGRLTRDNLVAERVINIAREREVSPFYVASPWCDLNTAAGRRMYRSLAVNDTGEAEDIQERTKRKKLEDAREGKTAGGRRTFGYGKVIGYDPIKQKDICDPYQVRDEETAVLKEGKRRTLAGDSQFTIVADWNRRGITTSMVGQTIKYKGEEIVCDGQWDVGKFKRTLLNEAYVQFDPTGHPTDCPCLENPETGGTRVHHDERHRAKWPHIFTRAEHDAMKAMFDGREAFWVRKPEGGIRARTYLLSGITECGGTWRDTAKKGQYCGGDMYGQGKTYPLADGTIKRQRRYACKKWNRRGERIGCCSVFRIADAVEAYVTEQVLYRFDSPEIVRALAPVANELRMAEVIQELSELQARRELLAAEYAAGDHDKDDYRVMRKTVLDKMTALDTEKKQLMSAKAKSLAVPTDGGLRDVWENASMDWRASVVKLVVEKVVINPGLPGGKFWPDRQGWRFDPDLIEIVWLH
ncbi:site-specific DNA recombinase [Streptomyces aurantiacus]|uniref:recombinase family protein n=1 Tax=Streptomyces aurantiacus TaxID=47760 RepID=UPI0027934CE7|nr:recombinase family protein [Streptomyces aurantiacus]MDQ0776350.1 site-specific DNA recombinase [Streptomyces aurantiacus]